MFKKILLISNKSTRGIIDSLHKVIDYLQGKQIAIVLDEFTAALIPERKLASLKDGGIEDCDLAIAIGGDGTMLRAAHLLTDYDIPLLGINHGRLGFLADIPADSMTAYLERIMAGEYVEDRRIQLFCEVMRDGETLLVRHAFNDVIVQKGNVARLMELDTFVNADLLHHQRSDGMIVASPTGTTAYALSGGGPILHPALDALVLVPICPHTLSNRPIVIDGNSTIRIAVVTQQEDPAKLTCDGEIVCDLNIGDSVRVEKKHRTIRLIHPIGHDHFSILRAKLGWG
ncbi:MAG: NAD(+) kinase [Gammaproteobacteria bacterium]